MVNVVFLCCGTGERMKPITPKYHKSLIPVHSQFFGGGLVPNLENSIEVVKDCLKSSLGRVVVSGSPDYCKKCLSDPIFSDRNLEFCEIVNELGANNSRTLVNTLEVSDFSPKDDLLVIEGDVYLKRGVLDDIKSVVTSPLKKSYAFCTYRKNEWVYTRGFGEVSYDIIKGFNGLSMSGVTLINCELIKDLTRVLSKSPLESFWDESFIEALKITRNPLEIIDVSGLIEEFDSPMDLINSRILTESEVVSLVNDKLRPFYRLKSMTNHSYLIEKDGNKMILRIPGKNTDKFINREREKYVEGLVNPDVRFYQDSIKISPYFEGFSPISSEDSRNIKTILRVLREVSEVHRSQVRLEKDYVINLIDEVDDYLNLADKKYLKRKEFQEVSDFYSKLIIKLQHQRLGLCHRDLDPGNILVNDVGDIKLVDFEYSGILNIYWDFGSILSEFSLHFNFEDSEIYSLLGIMKRFYRVNDKEVFIWSGIVDYVWSCWSLAKASLDDNFDKKYYKDRWKRCVKVKKLIEKGL